MGAKHPKLSNRKSSCVEINCARHDAKLVTDDAKMSRETLEAAIVERHSALEGIGATDDMLAVEKGRVWGSKSLL